MRHTGTLFLVLGLVGLAILLAGCSEQLGDPADVERLASPEAAERSAAASRLCASQAGRALLRSAVGPQTALDVLASAHGRADCFEQLPVAERARFLLEAQDLSRPVEELVGLGRAADPVLFATLDSENRTALLRAGTCLLRQAGRLAPAERSRLVDASAAMVLAGVGVADLAPLGDEALVELLQTGAVDPPDGLLAALQGWWAKLPGSRRAELLAASLRVELRVRSRYPLGASAWAGLVFLAPLGLSGVDRVLLRTSSVVAVVDGRELTERPWPLGRSLGLTEPVHLELGTLAGGAVEGAGDHELRLRFTGELFLSGLQEDPSTLRPDWTGQLSSRPAAFSVVAMRPQELVRSEATPSPDPADRISIQIHIGGRPIPLWPPSDPAAKVVLQEFPLGASLWVASSEPLPVDLAFEVVAIPAAGASKPQQVGTLSASGRLLGPAPVLASRLDLSQLAVRGPKGSLRLRLVPSAEVAARDPRIEIFWDHPLKLGALELQLPEPPR